MRWHESPQYLKAIQKIQGMDPQDKAVTQTLVDQLSGMYADRDMQRQLQAMRIASEGKQRERDVRLAEAQQNISQESFKNQRDANRLATNLGWANIGLAGLRGYADLVNKRKIAGQLSDLATLYGR